MRKKTMQALFFSLFIIGVFAGYLIPGDLWELNRRAEDGPKAGVYDVSKRMGQLDQQTPYFKYMVLVAAETGSVELLRIDAETPLHKHPNENHFLYIFKGKAKVVLGNSTLDAFTGQVVVIPAGMPHKVDRVGDVPLEVVLFSSPPFDPKDTVVLEEISD